MHLWFLRGCFFALLIGMATGVLVYLENQSQNILGIVVFTVMMVLGIAVVGIDLFLPNKQITTLSAVYFGLLLGLLIGSLFSLAMDPFIKDIIVGSVEKSPERSEKIVERAQLAVHLLITLVCCYFTISTLLQTKDEFRFIIPYVEFSKQVKGGRPLVLDTSVIIDGRIADICDTRIIDTKLIVPRFVLQELQSIADSSDKLKRNRGRRGLDMLKRMQNNPKVELQMHEGNIPQLRDVLKVDERLVVLAKAMDARVVTNDFNLNKIAQLQGVEVINLNEVANAVKSVALPGETMIVKVVKPGDQIGQGVGYLDDGTMVVVEQGRSAIGQEVGITSDASSPGLMIRKALPPAPCPAALKDRPAKDDSHEFLEKADFLFFRNPPLHLLASRGHRRIDGLHFVRPEKRLRSPARRRPRKTSERRGIGRTTHGCPSRLPARPGTSAQALFSRRRCRASSVGRGRADSVSPRWQAGFSIGVGCPPAHAPGRLQHSRSQ